MELRRPKNLGGWRSEWFGIIGGSCKKAVKFLLGVVPHVVAAMSGEFALFGSRMVPPFEANVAGYAFFSHGEFEWVRNTLRDFFVTVAHEEENGVTEDAGTVIESVPRLEVGRYEKSVWYGIGTSGFQGPVGIVRGEREDFRHDAKSDGLTVTPCSYLGERARVAGNFGNARFEQVGFCTVHVCPNHGFVTTPGRLPYKLRTCKEMYHK